MIIFLCQSADIIHNSIKEFLFLFNNQQYIFAQYQQKEHEGYSDITFLQTKYAWKN